MKYIIASDIHGSFFYTQKIIEIMQNENADTLILLGDIYNHGPRNNLPSAYEPMNVANALNSIKDKLIVIKGNCDSQVDTMISEFDFIEHIIIVSGNKRVFLTHGHVYNENNLPKTKVDALIYGHFHVGMIKRDNGITLANPGSISLPKLQSARSYLVLEDDLLILKNIDGEIITQDKID